LPIFKKDSLRSERSNPGSTTMDRYRLFQSTPAISAKASIRA
jgi:hypothetical protein